MEWNQTYIYIYTEDIQIYKIYSPWGRASKGKTLDNSKSFKDDFFSRTSNRNAAIFVVYNDCDI